VNAQLSLDVGPIRLNPEAEAFLKTAFAQSRLSERMSFEEAMDNRAIALCVRNVAHAIARRIESEIAP
jgi:hypothetical protein